MASEYKIQIELNLLGVIQIIRDTWKCQSVTQTVLTFLLMLFLEVTSNTQVQDFALKHTLSLLKDFKPQNFFLKKRNVLWGWGGRGGGSEKCQKSVTYYLNGPLYTRSPTCRAYSLCLTRFQICKKNFVPLSKNVPNFVLNLSNFAPKRVNVNH